MAFGFKRQIDAMRGRGHGRAEVALIDRLILAFFRLGLARVGRTLGWRLAPTLGLG